MTPGTDSPVRVGIVGLGLASRTHLDGYRLADGCELAAVCDVAERKVAPVVEATGVRGSQDYRSIFADPAIDAVALLLPPPAHYPVGVEALASGKHVCMAKPFTVTAVEADGLIELAAGTGLTLAVAESTRYVQAYVEARRMFATGCWARSGWFGASSPTRSSTSGPRWTMKRRPGSAKPTGAVRCSIAVRTCLTCSPGSSGRWKRSRQSARSWVPDIPLDNHSVVTGRMVSGEFFSVEFCSLTEYPRGERVEIYGSDGTVIIDQVLDPPMVLFRNDRDLRGTAVAGVHYDIQGWKAESTRATARDFVEAVRLQRPPGVTAEESRYVVSLIERAYESVASGGLEVDARRCRL